MNSGVPNNLMRDEGDELALQLFEVTPLSFNVKLYGLRPTVSACDVHPALKCVVSLSVLDEQEAVQKRTFTKWINSHLAKVSLNIHPCTPHCIAIVNHLPKVGDCRILKSTPSSSQRNVKAIASHILEAV